MAGELYKKILQEMLGGLTGMRKFNGDKRYLIESSHTFQARDERQRGAGCEKKI